MKVFHLDRLQRYAYATDATTDNSGLAGLCTMHSPSFFGLSVSVGLPKGGRGDCGNNIRKSRLVGTLGHVLDKMRTPSYWNPAYDLVDLVAVVPYSSYYVSYRTESSLGPLAMFPP